jgi:hypothetical protein
MIKPGARTTLSVPARNLWLERVGTLRVAAYVAAGMLIVAMVLALAAWVAEYILVGTELAEWLEKRWFVLILIACLIITALLQNKFEKRSAWSLLEQYSSLDTGTGISTEECQFLTGGIKIGRVQVGPATVLWNANGIVVWKQGRLRAWVPWEVVERVERDATMARRQEKARVILRRRGRFQLELSLPWNSAAERIGFIQSVDWR